MAKAKGSKKVAPAPYPAKKKDSGKVAKNPLFEKRPRNFGIGQDIQPKRDLTRFVKWPEYIRLQRQPLCRKMEVPYVIVKSKARLGTVVHKKTATALAIVDIREEDKTSLNNLVSSIKLNYNDKFEENRKQWGGAI
ncbi:7713_t:CDS:2 [Entrophospora sp. SA101]|nr:7713_t:CDS:2 [Entrophospora sp. SA101]